MLHRTIPTFFLIKRWSQRSKKLAKNNFSHLNLPNFSTVISERSGEILLFWERGYLSLRFATFRMMLKKCHSPPYQRHIAGGEISHYFGKEEISHSTTLRSK
ncbi:MAG TPA: hypothetical protein PK110_13380 [Niabella sp.]|nr:hypothetical protein [Niabella sp.]